MRKMIVYEWIPGDNHGRDPGDLRPGRRLTSPP
jgi:hypothetical protein